MADMIKLSDIKPNPNNPRIIKDDKFQKLVKSIKEFPKMKKTLFIMLMVISSTVCSKAQGSIRQWCFGESDTKRMFEADRENPLLKEKVLEQDSIITELKGVLAEAGLLQESLEREAHLCNETVKIQSEQLDAAGNEIQLLETKVEKTEDKYRRQKNLKWWFGGGGLLAGIIIPLIYP